MLASIRWLLAASLVLVGGACSRTPSGAPDTDAAVEVDAAVTVDAAPDIDTGHDAAVLPPACPDAFVLMDAANLGEDGVYRAHVASTGHLDEVSCARDGPSTEHSGVIVHLTATVEGTWTLRSIHDHITTQQLRRDCSDPSTETVCSPSSAFGAESYPIVWNAAAGESIDWLLRSRDDVATFDVEAWPPRGDGESCAVVSSDHTRVSVGCTPPLVCQNWADAPTCAIDTPPTLERAELYLGSLGGHLVVWGTDQTPTLYRVNGVGPSSLSFEYFIVAPRFEGDAFVVDIREPFYASDYYDVRVYDFSGTPSNVVRLVPQPSGMNEPCEIEPTYCETGFTCQPDGEGTMRCLP